MAQQTAVGWLVDQLLDGKLLMPSLIEQTEQMEKEQIIETFDNGAYVGTYAVDKDGEQYYKETYNK